MFLVLVIPYHQPSHFGYRLWFDSSTAITLPDLVIRSLDYAFYIDLFFWLLRDFVRVQFSLYLFLVHSPWAALFTCNGGVSGAFVTAACGLILFHITVGSFFVQPAFSRSVYYLSGSVPTQFVRSVVADRILPLPPAIPACRSSTFPSHSVSGASAFLDTGFSRPSPFGCLVVTVGWFVDVLRSLPPPAVVPYYHR